MYQLLAKIIGTEAVSLRSPTPMVEFTAERILYSFTTYFYGRFREITDRGKFRFENRDWSGVVADGQERLELYRHVLDQIVGEVEGILGDHLYDRFTWETVRSHFQLKTLERYDADLATTFFYSIMRRILARRGLPVEYDDDGIASVGNFPLSAPVWQYHAARDLPGMTRTIKRIMMDSRFIVRFRNLDTDAHQAAVVINDHLERARLRGKKVTFEMLTPIFYRNKGAYIVGRIIRKGETVMPVVFSLRNPNEGITIDAVLTEEADLRTLFSYTRSNFHVAVDAYRETLRFLATLMPHKSTGGLYSSIGFIHPAKIELNNYLRRHLASTGERFVLPPGTKGWVMVVFTLPTFPYVFKVIADYTAKENRPTRQSVIDKYNYVHRTDRGGRMLDALVYTHLQFRRADFAPEVLEELLRRAPSVVDVQGDNVLLKHVYVESKTTPLDVFFQRERDPEKIRSVLYWWGVCIRDLAAVGIWIGDAKPKNFGLTEYGRVVSFDYDEIGPLTDYHFMDHFPPHIPAGEDEDATADTDFQDRYVYKRVPVKCILRDMDIPEPYQADFLRWHHYLTDTSFWIGMQERLRRGEIVDLSPYPVDRRLAEEFERIVRG